MEVRRAKRNAETHEVVTLPGQWGRVLPLWSPWLLSVGGWAFHLLVSYAVVDWYCRGRSALPVSRVQLLLHGVTLFSLALALTGVLLAARHLRLLDRESDESDQRAAYARSRFLTLSALVFSVYMSAIILLEEWGNFVLVPCQ